MKKIFALLILSVFLLSACTSADDNVDFDTIGQTFEFTTTFNNANDFNQFFVFDQDIVQSDVVLMFRRDGIANGLEIWEPLPTASFFFFNNSTGAIEGFLNYIFNFTIADVQVILNSDDPQLAGPEFTDNQRFRIVVVPSDFALNTEVDLLNFNALSEALNLEF